MSTTSENRPTHNLATAVSSITRNRWQTELDALARKHHRFVLWLLLVSILLPTGLDIGQFPSHWKWMLLGRAVVVGLSLLCYMFHRKGKVNAYWLITLPVAMVMVHSGCLFSLANSDFLITVNVAFAVMLTMSGLFLILETRHIAVILAASYTSAVYFLVFHSDFTLTVWADRGGILLILGGIFFLMLGRLRWNSRVRDISTQLALADGQELLDERNRTLEEAQAQLEAANSRLEEQVRIKTASLRQSNLERDEVVYRLSHDFKVPMVNVRSLVAIAREERDLDMLARLFSMMEQNLQQFERLLVDMDHFLSVTKGEVQVSAFKIGNLIRQVWDDAIESADQKMTMEFVGKGETVVHTDRQKLGLALDTVFRNSMQYQKDGVAGTVKVTLNEKEEQLHLCIEDDGVGISSDILPKVRDLFFRGHSKSAGLGLGLYLADNTLTQLGGAFHIASEDGGTQVELILPKRRKSAEAG